MPEQAGRGSGLLRNALLIFAIFCAWVRPLEAHLRGYDDAYYARKALEVIRSGEWLALPFNGSPTFDNPPLGIWSESFSFLIFGPSDAAARFPSAAYGVITVLLLHSWARRRFRSADLAFMCAALFLCNSLYIKYLRRGMLDVGCLFWSVAGVWLAERKALSRPMHAASGIAFGLAFLTKSMLALSVPAALISGWAWEGAEGRWRLRAWIGPALAGFSGVAGLWLVAMTSRFGGAFVRGHFVWLLWEKGIRGAADSTRLQTLADLGLVMLPAGLLMVLSLPGTVAAAASRRPEARVALAWALVPCAILLAVGSRKLWYFIPALPGVAMVAALGLERWTTNRPAARRGLMGGTLALWTAGAAVVLAWPGPLQPDRTAEIRAIAQEVRARTGSGTSVLLVFPGPECPWNVRNEFLWYADRPVSGCTGAPPPPGHEPEAGAGWVLTTPEGERALGSAGWEVSRWSQRGALVLVTVGKQ
jgi:4-amino-4-deoxy-L-arabinose transferase-like glycosyltransferase